MADSAPVAGPDGHVRPVAPSSPPRRSARGCAFLDGTVVNVALRTIGEDLDASLAQLQWITNGYLLSLASLILLGGSLGDRFGRRRVFVVGVVWFAAGLRCCAGSPRTPRC